MRIERGDVRLRHEAQDVVALGPRDGRQGQSAGRADQESSALHYFFAPWPRNAVNAPVSCLLPSLSSAMRW